jgi:putative ABC transport system ATP-binding protein
MANLVELEDVTKLYEGSDAPALNRATLAFPEAKISAILGPSGSGKSTLLNVIAGIDRPTDGKILVDGVEVSRLGEAALARYRRTSVGLIFQFFNLLNNLTVLDNVLIPAQLAGMGRSAGRERAAELLQLLAIEDQADKYPARLSGGQRQRVAIARALVNRPALLLADEPTGALDSRSGEQVIHMLQELNRAGQTILLVTHDTKLAQASAHRVVSLADGSLLESSPALQAVR